MFTIKRVDQEGNSHVTECKGYVVSKDRKRLVAHCQGVDAEFRIDEDTAVIYVENSNGKTCDILRR